MEAKEIAEAAVKACNPPTRYELAKRLKTDWHTVDEWVKGRRDPRGRNLLRMLQIAQDAVKGKGAAMLMAAGGIALAGALLASEVHAATPAAAAIPLCIMLNRLFSTYNHKNRPGEKHGASSTVAF